MFVEKGIRIDTVYIYIGSAIHVSPMDSLFQSHVSPTILFTGQVRCKNVCMRNSPAFKAI